MLQLRRAWVLPKHHHYASSVFALSSSSSSSVPLSFLISTSRHPSHFQQRRSVVVAFSSGTHPPNHPQQSRLFSSTTATMSQETTPPMAQPPPLSQTLQDALSKGKWYTDNIVYRFLQLPVSNIQIALQVVAQATATATTKTEVSTTTTSPCFVALLLDKDEVTIMIPSETYDQFSGGTTTTTTTTTTVLTSDNHQVGIFSYRLITFDVVLEPTLVGFMAYITKALAQAQISVLPFAAYSRDHIFVQEADLDQALRVLKCLVQPPEQK
jgi:hypothetical protein